MIITKGNFLKRIVAVASFIVSSVAVSAPSEVADFSTSVTTLSIPFVKVNGSLAFKNAELFLNLSTNKFELRNIEEILPNDVINIEENISLADGSFKEFKFSGFENVPILISTERNSGSLNYQIQIVDSSDFIQLTKGTFASGKREISFTPTFDDVFTVRVIGTNSSGSLNIEGSVLTSGAVSLRNQVQPINLDEGKEGVLADNSFDEYKFTGTPNTPIVIRTQRSTGSLNYVIKIFDSTGTLILNKGTFASGLREIPFTPTSNNEYIIRIEGTNSFGQYVLSIINL